MTWLIGFASFAISLYSVLMLHNLDNDVANAICFIGLGIVYSVCICIAADKEDKLKSRIKVLEDKLNDKEERK